MDTITREQRSYVMSRIRSRDTLPEIVVRKWLWREGYRFRCQYKKLPGKPDIALPRLKTLIEVRGCFWHHHGWKWDGRKLVQVEECQTATSPKSNKRFWNAKFRANVRRDERHEREWSELGWKAIIIWECALKDASAREKTFSEVKKTLKAIEGAMQSTRR